MPGIKATGLADWYLVRGDKWDFDGYVRGGGDISRCIFQWMSDDDKLETMWGNPRKRVDWVLEKGITRILSMDFSTWSQLPVVMQLYNVYRSAIVNRDFARAGLQIIPCMKVGLQDQIHAFNGFWPDEIDDCPIAINAHHMKDHPLTWKMFGYLSDYIAMRWPNRVIWMWTKSQKPVLWWRERIGPCVWVPTRCYFQAKVVNERLKLREKNHG